MMNTFKKIVQNKITLVWFYDVYRETKKFNILFLKNICSYKLNKYISKIALFERGKTKKFVYNFLSGLFSFEKGGFSSAESLFNQNEVVKYQNSYWDNISLYYAFISYLYSSVNDLVDFEDRKAIKYRIKKGSSKYLKRLSINLTFDNLNTLNNLYYKQTEYFTNLLDCVYKKSNVKSKKYNLVKYPYLINFILLSDVKVCLDKKSENILFEKLLFWDFGEKSFIYKRKLTRIQKKNVLVHSRWNCYHQYKNDLINWLKSIACTKRYLILSKIKDVRIVDSVLDSFSIKVMANTIKKCELQNELYRNIENRIIKSIPCNFKILSNSFEIKKNTLRL